MDECLACAGHARLAALDLTVGMLTPAAARLSDAYPPEYRGLIEQAAEDFNADTDGDQENIETGAP